MYPYNFDRIFFVFLYIFVKLSLLRAGVVILLRSHCFLVSWILSSVVSPFIFLILLDIFNVVFISEALVSFFCKVLSNHVLVLLEDSEFISWRFIYIYYWGVYLLLVV